MRHHPDCRCNKGPLTGADVSWITPQIAVGGQPHEVEIPELKALGITHILNVNWPDRPEDDAIQSAFRWLDLPILDDEQPKPASWYRAGIQFAGSMSPNDRLLVHCGHGINRGPVMAYAILLAQGHVDADAMVRSARPQAGYRFYMASAEAAVLP